MIKKITKITFVLGTVLALTACSEKGTDKEKVLHNGGRLTSVWSEDGKVYFKNIDNIKVLEDGKLKYYCNNKDCNHDDYRCVSYCDSKWSSSGIFSLNNKLYSYYQEGEGGSKPRMVIDCIDDYEAKEVLRPRSDEDLKPKEGESTIYGYSGFVTTVDDKHILLSMEDGTGILLDSNFNELYRYSDIGAESLSLINGNDYYYLNYDRNIVKVNLETKEGETLIKNGEILYIDLYKNNLYYLDNEGLFKYNLKTGSSKKIKEDIGGFKIIDKKIFYLNMAGDMYRSDLDGKDIYKIRESKHMEPMQMFLAGDRIYCNLLDTMVSINKDGEDYKEY
ncbi:MAG: DUF5050 domain-containing protein [Lachnospiraceae bacterium]|nr:DUF5050 domain-containing protein [Lachnospiraceae bacterium]